MLVVVLDEVFGLFLTLGATDEQAEFPVVYASAKNGYALHNIESFDAANPPCSIIPILETIMAHVPPAPDLSANLLRMQVVNLGYDDYLGRLGIGRIYEGTMSVGQQVVVVGNDGVTRKGKIAQLFTTLGLQRVTTQTASSGDIVTIAGISDIYV